MGILGVGVIAGSLLYVSSAGSLLRADDEAPAEEVGTPLQNPEPSSGKQIYRLDVDGARRTFIVYRPATLAEDEKATVVFMFHGGGGNATGPYQDSGWTEKADEEGFMVVYPQALKYHVYSEEKVSGGRVVQDVAEYATRWGSYNLEKKLDPEYPEQEIYDDVAFTRAMVAFVKSGYAVDDSRIYASGFSNGGSMVERLMIETTDIFAAFAPSSSGGISPEETEEMLEEYKPFTFEARPTMRLLGSLDPKLTHVSQVTEFSIDETAAEEGDPVHERYIEGQLAILDLLDSYDYQTSGKVSHFAYTEPVSGSGSNAEYHLYVVDGMMHVYPHGRGGSLSAPDLAWDFFTRFSL